ncbi:MAG: hypothetical protein H0W49_06585 [Nitrospirales bacterium]|nr:hypothetical protein [Nitrospirales bacterium]
MSSSCLKHNRADQCLAGLRDHGVMFMWDTVPRMAAYLRGCASYSVCVWGVLIFMGLMGEAAGKGTSPLPSHPSRLVRTTVAQDDARHGDVNRRDPFKRIPKRLPTSKVSNQSDPEPKIVPVADNPVWRLLGVMHGQDGHQAVIQVSPTERVLVQPGAELARSGWTIKTISEEEVLLEHLSSASSVRGTSPTRTFILSFPAIQ